MASSNFSQQTTDKHVCMKKAWESGCLGQGHWMGRQLLKEAARLSDQEVDIAGQPVRGHLALHQSPDPLGWVDFMGGIFGEPEHLNAAKIRLPTVAA